VWMQRWLHEGKAGAPAASSPAAQPRLRRRPVYVDQRVHSLAELLR